MRALETNSSGSVSEFLLLGFPCSWEIQILLFVIFSLIYLLTLTGNTSIICAVWSSRKLHTPMYALLANFSFLEVCYVSSDVPKMLASLISQTKTISYAGYLLQFYFFFSMCAAEGLFLSALSFDRFLAICRPLHYSIIMTNRLCACTGDVCVARQGQSVGYEEEPKVEELPLWDGGKPMRMKWLTESLCSWSDTFIGVEVMEVTEVIAV
ncbi:Olfactory receptor 11G2 [Sciurus carolinensis]|uniref:Olfactory receptor 11G2 n=1 Tax=Sciurus carolinensis TaxID=30640 RepID=A0AA41MD62_SCICA|nr:Olfactory receptor 11G2 [Sciurus carolinensis]